MAIARALLILLTSFLSFSPGDLSYIPNVQEFIYNGFINASLMMDGEATIMPDGLLRLTFDHAMSGKALHPTKLNFGNSSNGNGHSFSTTFVFALVPENNGHNRFEFQIYSNNFSSSNDFLYVDYCELFRNQSLSLFGKAVQTWVEYDGQAMQLNVTVSPIKSPKKITLLLSRHVNLEFNDDTYAGFYASKKNDDTNAVFHAYAWNDTACQYILAWSFKMNGVAESIDYSKLPSLPKTYKENKLKEGFTWGFIGLFFIALSLIIAAYFIRRSRKYSDVLEDWEVEYGPHRFCLKDLHEATDGFKEQNTIGRGGFGSVYKGILKKSNKEVGIKRISHESRQGIKEFVAEIVSLGRLRHRNLVKLLGYCRSKGELMLVYDFMENGSLDQLLRDQTKPVINWEKRLEIIKGIGSALLYLHESWEKIIIHRDVKASNVLLDATMNARLSDFGLARFLNNGTDAQATRVVGTRGYMAPELVRTGKATTSTDLFAFGIFILEVACGKRPTILDSHGHVIMLVDWVLKNWQRGSILESMDPRFTEDFVAEEMVLILKLGLLCSHPLDFLRPSMRQTMEYLEKNASLPELMLSYESFSRTMIDQYSEVIFCKVPPLYTVATISSLSGGR